MRILGKGITAKAISEQYPNSKIYDDNDIDIYDKDSLEFTVVSPGIPPYNDIVKYTKNKISDYDLFLCDDKFKPNEDIFSVWISGTNGKTTTTQMCEHILKHKDFIACGNIGLPLASAIKKNKKNLLIESSSYTLHYTSYAKPNIYILLPISDDHISWHGSFKEYEKSKLKPLDKLNEGEVAIVPEIYNDYKTNGDLITYKDSYDLANKLNIDIKKVNFKEPFLLDAILALSVEKILFDNISYEKINSFLTDEHKMEEFLYKDNILYVNDSKGTNIDATIQALKTYKNNKIHIILGGDDKGANLDPLFDELKQHDIIIYSIGTNTKKLYDLSIKNKLICYKCDILKNAIKKIKDEIKNINSKQVVLLSPAASSYDQFDSYKQRGEIFKKSFI